MIFSERIGSFILATLATQQHVKICVNSWFSSLGAVMIVTLKGHAVYCKFLRSLPVCTHAYNVHGVQYDVL